MMITTFSVFSGVLIIINLGTALDARQPKGRGKVLDYYESCPDKPLPNPAEYSKYDLEIDESEEESDLLVVNGEVSLTKPLDETKTIKSYYYAEVKKRGFWTQVPYTLSLNDTCKQLWADNQLWDYLTMGVSEKQKTCPIKSGEIYKFNNTKLQALLYDAHQSVPEGVYRITAKFTVYFTDYVEDACFRFFVSYKIN